MHQQTAIARSIPMEAAQFLRAHGADGVTIEQIAIGINRSEKDVEKHLPEARRLVRVLQSGRA